MSREVSVVQIIELFECSTCFMSFGVPADFIKARRSDHATFYCPNGHKMHFPDTSEAERLRSQLAESERLKQIAESDKAKLITEMKRIGERITNGVCPCCNRSFKDLRAHMKSKHSTVRQIA